MTSAVRPPDEFANVATHAVGVVLSGIGAAVLIRATAHSGALTFACAIYSVSLVLVYVSSTLSHLFRDLAWRRSMRTLDQACIFLLIAGTYTPFAVRYLDGGAWWLLLATMWLLALVGIGRVLCVRDLSRRDKIIYAVMGWLPAIALGEFSRHASLAVVVWILAGGICYSVGGIFLRWSARVKYFHAIWHICVIAGSACHFVAVWQAVTG